MDQDVFAAAGDLTGAYAAVDWAATPLGPPDGWTPALRAAVDLALSTRFPATLLWGPDFRLLYNEAYVPLIGAKHPAALGAPAVEVFPEVWDDIRPLLEQARDGAEAVFAVDLHLPLERRGFLEECWFTFSYSPVRGADGQVEGVVDIAVETTASIVDRRRLALLAALREELAVVRSPRELAQRALPVLRAAERDLPAVALALPGVPGGGDPRLPDGPAPASLEVAGGVARVPLGPPGALLTVLLSPSLPVDESYLDLLRLLAATLSSALERVQAQAAERRAVQAEQALSEALQRSLLTTPQVPSGLQVAVRYQPAAQQARVGGDWYDAFATADGAYVVVVGDVGGHDRQAAAAMAQVRNLLRGLAYASTDGPAGLLSALDAAAVGLDVGVLATAVVGRLEPAGDGWRLRWASAGHPPAVLRDATGTRLLEGPGDLLLGLQPGTPRQDEEVLLAPGATLLLWTDGLVERRGTPLDESLEQLRAAVADGPTADVEALCDALLARCVDAEDDVALLALRVG